MIREERRGEIWVGFGCGLEEQIRRILDWFSGSSSWAFLLMAKDLKVVDKVRSRGLGVVRGVGEFSSTIYGWGGLWGWEERFRLGWKGGLFGRVEGFGLGWKSFGLVQRVKWFWFEWEALGLSGGSVTKYWGPNSENWPSGPRYIPDLKSRDLFWALVSKSLSDKGTTKSESTETNLP